MAVLTGNRRVTVPVYLATMGTWASFAVVTVVLPFRFQQLGISVVEYGVALAAYALGTLVTEALWGYVAFRIGSPRWLGGLGAATAASLIALGFATTFAAFALLLAIYGMLVVYSTPLLRWLGLTALGPGGASRGLGMLGVFFGVGLSVGTSVGPLIYLVGGFWLNLEVGTALLVISTIPLMRVPWSTLSLPRTRSRRESSVGALLERGFAQATLLVILYFMAFTLVANFLQYYSIGLFHGTVEGAGYVIGAARAVSLGSGVLLGAFVDRHGPGRSAPVGFLLLTAGALGTWVSAGYAEMTAATLVFATGAGWLGVSLLPMALARIPPEHQGTAVGVFGSFEDLGLILGPLLLGVIYVSWGPRGLFPITALLSGAGLLVALAVRGPRRPSDRDRRAAAGADRA